MAKSAHSCGKRLQHHGKALGKKRRLVDIAKCAMVLCLMAVAPFATARAEVVKRTIIAINNASQFGHGIEDAAARHAAETPLNHIGLVVHHHDWSANGVPTKDVTRDARGALDLAIRRQSRAT